MIEFTHDVVQLLALEREAAEKRVPLLIQTVSRSPVSWECVTTVPRPWVRMQHKRTVAFLKNESLRTENCSYRFQTNIVDVIFFPFDGKLRETWERAIEEVLLNDANSKVRPSIETQRLKRVTIEPADYTLLTLAWQSVRLG